MGGRIPTEEVAFLVLHWLRAGPCRDSAEALEREALEHGLLPRVDDFRGGQQSFGYETLSSLFSHIPTSALGEIVSEAHRLHAHAGRHGSEVGQTSILQGSGPCSLIPSVRRRPPLRSLCMPPASERPTTFQKLMQRELGISARNDTSQGLLSSGMMVKKWQHLGTFRGHRTAVYCAIVTGDGRYVITGSDDCLVKIWNTRIGLLVATCRSHVGEITDISLNEDQSVVASASTDSTVRIWSMKEGELGRHLQVLVGHTSPVSFIGFHPFLTTALISSSFDGTCRLWDTASGEEIAVLRPGPNFAAGRGTSKFDNGGINTRSRAAAEEDQQEAASPRQVSESQALSCCSFNPSGECFVASSKSGTTYMWSWQVMGGKSRRKGPRTREQAAAGVPDLNEGCSMSPDNWPQPMELCVLEGHQADVALVMFSHHGCGLATASRDGQVRVWRPPKKRSRMSAWSETLALGTPPPPSSSRRRAHAPSVNQVAWRCDDRWILGAYSNSSIYVWDALSGDVVHHLNGHSSQVHVLECHPSDPRLCLSAGYDGFSILWDIEKGIQLIRFSSVDTHPGPCKWADPIQLADGHFMPDGQGVFLSDVTGQFSLYGTGPCLSKTPYDQFYLLDYDPVFQNEDGEVVDVESMEPQHRHGSRFSMCDYGGIPYDSDIQAAVRLGKLSLLREPEKPLMTPPGLLVHPPTATAAAWEATEKGLSQHSTNVRIQEALDRQQILEQAAVNQAIEAERQQREPDPPPDEALQDAGADDEMGVEPVNVTVFADNVDVMVDEDGYLLPEAAEAQSESDGGGDEGGSDYVQSSEEEEQNQEEEYCRYPTRRRTRMSLTSQTSRRSHSTAVEEEFNDTVDEEEEEYQELPEETPSCSSEEESEGFSNGRRRVRRPSRYSNGADAESSNPRRGRKRRRGAQGRGRSSPNEKARDLAAYSWLQETEPTEQFYIPQKGDNVVYLYGVHQQWFDENPHNGTVMPDWAETGDLRFAEPCEVTELEYVILKHQEGQPTVARLTLTFLDRERSYHEATIVVDVPPPNFGHEEFIIEGSRWGDAVETQWEAGDPCKVWYFNPNGDGGAWWNAVIVDDTLEGAQIGVDAWDCSALHKRYNVQWDINADDSDFEFVSPWDLFPNCGSDEGPSASTSSQLDDLVVNCIHFIIERVNAEQKAEHFRETLGPDASFPAAGGRHTKIFYNNLVPMPISLAMIMDRLQSPVYYRSLEAVKNDLATIVNNAIVFTGNKSEITEQAEFVFHSAMESFATELGEHSPGVPRQPRTRTNRERRQSMEGRVTFVRSLDEAGPSNVHQAMLESTAEGSRRETRQNGSNAQSSYQIQTRNNTRSGTRRSNRKKRTREPSEDVPDDFEDSRYLENGVQTRSRRQQRRRIGS